LICCESRVFKGGFRRTTLQLPHPFTMCGPVRRSYLRMIESVHMQEALWR